jgi:hypothetical protein
VREIKTVSWFVGRSNARGLYSRSKHHILSRKDHGRTLCGQLVSDHNGAIIRGHWAGDATWTTCQRCRLARKGAWSEEVGE